MHPRRFRRCLCPSVVPALSSLLAAAPCLVRLDLSANGLSDYSLAKLCEGLIRNRTITTLLLADNKLGATATATSTSSATAASTHAATSVVSPTAISGGGGAGPLLGELLSRNRALRELDLSDNPLGAQVGREDEGQGGG
jgi:hypothetical protein